MRWQWANFFTEDVLQSWCEASAEKFLIKLTVMSVHCCVSSCINWGWNTLAFIQKAGIKLYWFSTSHSTPCCPTTCPQHGDRNVTIDNCDISHFILGIISAQTPLHNKLYNKLYKPTTNPQQINSMEFKHSRWVTDRLSTLEWLGWWCRTARCWWLPSGWGRLPLASSSWAGWPWTATSRPCSCRCRRYRRWTPSDAPQTTLAAGPPATSAEAPRDAPRNVKM